MHRSSFLRMKWFVDNYISKITIKEKLKVLDVGSYEVNGSYRSLFPEEKFNYQGLDMEAGQNVDIVLKNPYDWSELETDFFDIVISGQAFEHIEFFWITMSEMTRVLKKEGLMCIIAPNGFSEHRYPVDCYRFFTDGMVALARYVSLEPIHSHTNCAPDMKNNDWYSYDEADAMLIARKNYSGTTKYIDLKAYVCSPPEHDSLRSGLIPYTLSRNIVKRVIRKIFRLTNK